LKNLTALSSIFEILSSVRAAIAAVFGQSRLSFILRGKDDG